MKGKIVTKVKKWAYGILVAIAMIISAFVGYICYAITHFHC